MGNAVIKFLRGDCNLSIPPDEPQSLGPHGVTKATVGLSALAQDLFNFDITSQVPEGLSRHVVSSKKAQAIWYKKLLQAWKESKPPPKTPEEAASLVIRTLKQTQNADIEGLLAFYGLPSPQIPAETSSASSSLPEGVKFKLHTLPVDARAVVDGDGLSVYVDTKDPRESASVPLEIHEAAIARSSARAAKNYSEADALHKTIINAGYRVIKGPNNEQILAKKYRIRLRGIDAPEGPMPYGKEAKDELVKLIQGKKLEIHAYGQDKYDRCVGDVYCDGVFVQEQLLKRGCAWHYVTHEQRPEFSKWEKAARNARRGLWALPDPEEPWKWRKDRGNGAWRAANVPVQVH
ncbi:probable staphylococcal-like nuclease CAN1 isoform X1 [Elaeis guineensis]|uniref:Probable staphylococcal-like nuclease CAN1 isoform X1 n=1 Tax=Elaeis guineensis var. tenera TaxID=51953 RepID=A0A6J0PHP3_ELAGV|nr:probable staphylococcal-like nuclease CAN1 isoform X1 [Elaeis guineensis]